MKNQINGILSSLICALLTISIPSNAQDLVLDMPCPKQIKNIEAIGVGDSILLSFNDVLHNFKRKTYWASGGVPVEGILPTGPFAAIKEDDGLYLYFLEKQKKSILLRAYVADKSKSLRITDMQVLLEGQILGFYQDQGLHLVLLDRNSFSLSFLTINKARLADSKGYNLPADLRWDDEEVDFYAPNSRLNSFKGFSNVRMFPEGDFLYITIDRKKRTDHSAAKGTIVAELNLRTSEISKSVFPIGKYAHIGSFVTDGKLFRTLPTPNAFLVDVHDLKTERLIHQDSIKPFLNFKCYFRYGRKAIIGHKAPVLTVMKESDESQPVIFVDQSQGGYEIQYGTYYNKSGGNDNYSTYDGQKIADVVGSAILQYQEKPGVHRYFSYVISESSGHVKTDKATTTLREKIDDYEVDTIPRIDYKTYFNYKDGVAGLYVNAETGRLFVVYYYITQQKKSNDHDSLRF